MKNKLKITPDIILPNEKNVEIGLSWRGKKFKIGKASWSHKGLFVFRSFFHQETNTPIQWGFANKKNSLFLLSKSIKHSFESDLHVTLHPPDKKNDGKMHVRSSEQEILEENRRRIKWFPVIKPFNLFHFYTPPVNTLTPTPNKIDFSIPLPNEVTNSISLRVDIYPPQSKIPLRPANLIANTPHFIAVIHPSAIPQRVSATLLWPANEKLSL